jgi:hypothetical protein
VKLCSETEIAQQEQDAARIGGESGAGFTRQTRCHLTIDLTIKIAETWSHLPMTSQFPQVVSLNAQLREAEAALSRATNSPQPSRSSIPPGSAEKNTDRRRGSTEKNTDKPWAGSHSPSAGSGGERVGLRDEREQAKLIEGLMRRLRRFFSTLHPTQ